MAKRLAKAEAAVVPAQPFLSTAVVKVLALTQFVCPLLFFTNLTRNPYYTQIALLNIAIALCGILWAMNVFNATEWKRPSVPLNWPFLVFIAVGLISTIHSWVVHPLLRPGIAYEGTRVWIFTIVNSFMAFYLPLYYSKPLRTDGPKLSIWTDIICAMIWAACWYGFHDMRSNDQSALMWDPYGGLLWIGGFLYAWFRVKRGEAQEFFHLIFAVAVLSGLYGVLQYLGHDIIWSSPVQPYGGRPVSTFGNPNFLSSYLLLVSPVAVGFALGDRSQSRGYLLVAVISIVSAICTLTRSTYVGLVAAFLVMGFLLYRPENAQLMKKVLLGAVGIVLLVVIFPHTPVSVLQSPLARFTEIFTSLHAHQSYGPWHQRLLIWSSAFDMLKERPLLGKGWGCFELFYPFYQGAYLFEPVFVQWRTHANNAHNVVMEFLSQVGIIGAGVAAWMFVSAVVGAVHVIRRRTDDLSRYVSAGLLAGWVGMVVDNFFGNVSIFFAVPAFLFWWNLGSVFSEAPESTETKPSGVGTKIFLSAFILVNIIATVYFVKRWNEEVHYFSGFKYAKTGFNQQSISELEAGYHWFGGDVNNNYELGNSYARKAKELLDKNVQDGAKSYVEKAIDAYRSALVANPGYDEIYFNLGVTQFQAGKPDDGAKSLEIALLINPLLHGGYEQLAQYFVSRGDKQRAISFYEQGLAAFPRDKNMWNNVGVLYSQVGKDKEAFNAFRQAYILDVTFAQAFQNIEAASRKAGVKDPLLAVPGLLSQMNNQVQNKNYDAALATVDQLVTLAPGNEQMMLARGKILLFLGHIDDAMAEFKDLVKLNGRSVEGHFGLGQAYLAQRNSNLARQEFETCLDLAPNYPDAKQALANLR